MYYLSQHGREDYGLDGNLKECREQFKAVVAGELKRARLVSRQATKHKLATDTFAITMGRDVKSSLWTTLALVKS